MLTKFIVVTKVIINISQIIMLYTLNFWKRKWQPILVLLLRESHDQRILAGYSPWGCKSWTWLSNYTTTYLKFIQCGMSVISGEKQVIWTTTGLNKAMANWKWLGAHYDLIPGKDLQKMQKQRKALVCLLCLKAWTSLSLFTFLYWGRKWQPTPVFLPVESQGRWSLAGCRLLGRAESDTTEVT